MAQITVPSQKDGLPGRESNQGRHECKSEALLLSRLAQCPKVTAVPPPVGEVAKEVLLTAYVLSLV